LCKTLVELHSADVNAVNHLIRTPLMVASEAGFDRVVDVLMVTGADCERHDNIGRQALRIAIEGRHDGCQKLLTAIHRSLTSHDVKAVLQFIERGNYTMDYVSPDDQLTPILVIAEYGRKIKGADQTDLERLLSFSFLCEEDCPHQSRCGTPKERINKDVNNCTPLCAAIKGNNVTNINLLLDSKANVDQKVEAPRDQQRSPNQEIEMEKGMFVRIHSLPEHHVLNGKKAIISSDRLAEDIFEVTIVDGSRDVHQLSIPNLEQINHLSPLRFAVTLGHIESVLALLQYEEKLFNDGEDLNEGEGILDRDAAFLTAVAYGNGNLPLATAMLPFGFVNPNYCRSKGDERSALLVAAVAKREDITEVLLRSNSARADALGGLVDAGWVDREEKNALHHACGSYDQKSGAIIEQMLASDQKDVRSSTQRLVKWRILEHKDVNGVTPFMAALGSIINDNQAPEKDFRWKQLPDLAICESSEASKEMKLQDMSVIYPRVNDRNTQMDGGNVRLGHTPLMIVARSFSIQKERAVFRKALDFLLEHGAKCDTLYWYMNVLEMSDH
jgi:ankyrin repeat protein